MKICGNCHKDLPETDFHTAIQRNGSIKLQAYCKDCQRQYATDYYKKNRATLRRKNVRKKMNVRDRNAAFITNYLLEHPCVDCGNKDIRVLEFDHVWGKKKRAITEMCSQGAIQTIIDEIKKCEVRCANCHRIKTCHELKHYRSKVVQPSIN